MTNRDRFHNVSPIDTKGTFEAPSTTDLAQITVVKTVDLAPLESSDVIFRCPVGYRVALIPDISVSVRQVVFVHNSPNGPGSGRKVQGMVTNWSNEAQTTTLILVCTQE
jgi:hypothetical protein